MEFSNKTLAILLVVAIVASLSTTFIALNRLNKLSSTGYAVQSGLAYLNVTSSASVKIVPPLLDFGAGSINSTGGFNNCTIWINDTSTFTKTGCLNFSDTATPYGPFFIENDGNTQISVTLNASKNSTAFIGGNVSIVKFQYTVGENETSACQAGLGPNTWTDFNRTDMTICSNLSYVDTKDTLRIGVKVVVPYDAPISQNTVTIYATGTQTT